MEDNKHEKNPLLQWAENEVKLACHHENPDWDGKSFDYGCACYQSALVAFEALCGVGHSENSWYETVHILERLCHHLPLTPITIRDFGYIPGVSPEMVDPKTGATLALARIPATLAWESEDGTLNYNCERNSGIYLKVRPDGTYMISDVNRIVCVNIECLDDTYNSGTGNMIVNEMFPISLPYYPSKNRYEVYIRTFLTDPTMGDFDTKEVVYVKKPNGEKVPVNRYFHEYKTEKGSEFREITKEQYDELLKKRIDTQERKITGHIASDIVDKIFDEGERVWEQMLGTKWKPDYDDEQYEEHKDEYLSYDYSKVWWALMRSVRKDESCDDQLKALEKSVAECEPLMSELSRWGVYRAIANQDEEFLKKHPELQDVYDKAKIVYDWVNEQYNQATVEFNEIAKELNAIEDKDARIHRRNSIIKEIENTSNPK